ncbi:MAG: iron ABC transporter permease, partial [Defluviitaleaceae bacterium]|nr:iron ABC transporter permease [Defluviitaleaceae bacterium]
MSNRIKCIGALLACIIVIVLAVAIGSVYIQPGDILNIVGHQIFGTSLEADVGSVVIVWNLRLPRALLAFIAGAALSVSGAVMQSVLRNPLASSYTIGVSSGASLGAAVVILLGVAIPFAGALTLPLVGFVSGLATILFALSFAARIDGRMENHTVILVGMVFSLFVNAITTLIMAMSHEHMQRLIFWQMGSFSMRDWQAVYILAPVAVIGTLLIVHYHRELDMMTFGEESAKAMGVNLKQVKWILLVISAAMTGSVIAFVGVIGFVDLVAPHVVRKLFKSDHRWVVPMSALVGGAFMVACDLVARTIVSPRELPVGAVTAMVGAPFFAYVYL